ncbi:phytoene synthase [Sporocytophaga myxococcoides]|uniref:Phytoene synthase n=2 Tax=Sporocytophaga myxococcoides TaxID=153721 RepID=A0A098LFE5_9BACT|nr:phytoene synthase [Sporocytophaga myxococcoides]
MVINTLSHHLRDKIYSIYAFAALAEEIVTSLENRDKKELISEYINETYKAIERRFSLNPILNSFQIVINEFQIDTALIRIFLEGIKLKIYQIPGNSEQIELYETSAAEALGLMILKALCDGNHQLYETLETSAKKFSSTILMINKLTNSSKLYHNTETAIAIQLEWLSKEMKIAMEISIEDNLKKVKENIDRAPQSSKRALYIAYAYYSTLFKKIKKLSSEKIITNKIGISYNRKIILALNSVIKQKLNLL